MWKCWFGTVHLAEHVDRTKRIGVSFKSTCQISYVHDIISDHDSHTPHDIISDCLKIQEWYIDRVQLKPLYKLQVNIKVKVRSVLFEMLIPSSKFIKTLK